uniref:Protein DETOXIFICATION n=1 Tax=Oryza punctata TaxID=4537 RepID=A0A0E0MBZ2_ORYPU
MEKPGDGDKLTVPLLEPKPATRKHQEDDAEQEEEEVASVRRRLVEENKKLWVVAGPSICARFSSFGVTVISQAFIGHIGATELAAYALVSTVLMRFSNGILGNHTVSELWYNTILVLLTGYMKNAEVALDALSICLNINGWEMMISIGFLSAIGVRVANELGAGSARRAKFAIFNVVTTSFLIGFALFVLFLFFRGRLAYIFTENKAVANEVADLTPLLAFSILLNSVQPVLSGVAIGSGWQSVVAYVNITSYYLIGIPLGAILGYVLGFQAKGIWIGMLLGTLVQTLVLLFITLRTDWKKQVEITRERLNRWYMDENGRSRNSIGNP